MGLRIGSTAPCRLADLVEIELPTIDVTLVLHISYLRPQTIGRDFDL